MIYKRDQDMLRLSIPAELDDRHDCRLRITLTQVEINELFGLAQIGAIAHTFCESSRKRDYALYTSNAGDVRCYQLKIGSGFGKFKFSACLAVDHDERATGSLLFDTFACAVLDAGFTVPNVSDLIVAEHFIIHAQGHTARPGALG